MRRPALLSLMALGCAPSGDGPRPQVTDARHAEIAFSTELGGRQRDPDMARDVVSDQAGNLYVTGGTFSPDFPVTAGAYDTAWSGGQFPSDAFVAKLAPDGAILWATRLGGTGYELAFALELTPDGDVVVAGRAGPGLPVTPGVVQAEFGGDTSDRVPYGRQDGFVCRLSGDGAALRFCTYLGTGDGGFIRGLALDAEGHIVVIMSSPRGDLPAAWFRGAFQPASRGEEDVAVVKLSGDGTRVLWATYLGGSGIESGAPAVAVAPDGSVAALLSTRSPDLPTPGGFDSTLGGEADLYLARLSPDGRRLLMGTYIGGSGIEGIEAHGLAIAPDGSLYVTGGSGSLDLPVTPGSWQPRPPGDDPQNAFVLRIAPGGGLVAGTYVGGTGMDNGEGIAVDGEGRVYLTGYTESADLFGLPGAVPDSARGDLFVARLSADLGTLEFGARIGGRERDLGRAVAPAPDGWIVVAGQSASPDWPAHAALGTRGPMGQDAVVVRLRPRAP